MDTLRRAHASMLLATRDLNNGRISEHDYAEIRAQIHSRMEELEQEGHKAQARALKNSLMASTARLRIRAPSDK